MIVVTATSVGPSLWDHGAGELRARAHRMVEPVVRRSVESMPDSLRLMAGYHLGWWDTAGVPSCGRPGKELRAALVLGAAAGCGGGEQAAAPAAAAVELVHNFTLVHDDVMDRDTVRRGRATVWSVWGVTNAILLGDALHALAIRVLATELPGAVCGAAVARLEAAVLELCRGQHADCDFETRERVGPDEYVSMVRGKTGALMGCACALGALCAGADAVVVSAMDTFGRELGIAFQCVDDVLGVWGDPVVTGKPAGGDLARRKRTLPVVAALESGTEAGARLAALYGSDRPMTEGEIDEATEWGEEAGGRRVAAQYAADRLGAALAALPGGAASTELRALAHVLVARNA